MRFDHFYNYKNFHSYLNLKKKQFIYINKKYKINFSLLIPTFQTDSNMIWKLFHFSFYGR